jgi:predicted enzyme related to lactoylglutathione lyase
MAPMAPTLGNGKICYVDFPATDIERSADFYQKVFGWHVRTRGDGSVAFDDGVGEVSGTWTIGRAPAAPGAIIYVMVDNAVATCETIVANGGEIVQSIGADAPEITALFRDPGGNIVGLYQQPNRPRS